MKWAYKKGMGGFPYTLFPLKISSPSNSDCRGWDLIFNTTELKIIPSQGKQFLS